MLNKNSRIFPSICSLGNPNKNDEKSCLEYAGNNLSSGKRYDGLDSFRIISIYGVILLHVASSYPVDSFIYTLMRIRDCIFPCIVLSSFFLLANSVLKNPNQNFRGFLTTRFCRLEIPLLIWTSIYWLIYKCIWPIINGREMIFPPKTLLLSGYMHLWYLQFIFIGALVIYPFLKSRVCQKHYRFIITLVCLIISLFYGLWLRHFIENILNTSWIAHGDLSFSVFVEQVNKYFLYIPIALSVALYAEEIVHLYKYRIFRLLSLLFFVITLSLHLGLDTLRLTKFAYSLAIFIVILRPLSSIFVKTLRPIITYTYTIYILHFLIIRFVDPIFSHFHIVRSGAYLITESAIIFILSLLVSILLRKLFSWDWFLPLISIDIGLTQEPSKRAGYGVVELSNVSSI